VNLRVLRIFVVDAVKVALAGLLTSEASAAIPETLLPSILATVKTVAATTARARGLHQQQQCWRRER